MNNDNSNQPIGYIIDAALELSTTRLKAEMVIPLEVVVRTGLSSAKRDHFAL